MSHSDAMFAQGATVVFSKSFRTVTPDGRPWTVPKGTVGNVVSSWGTQAGNAGTVILYIIEVTFGEGTPTETVPNVPEELLDSGDAEPDDGTAGRTNVPDYQPSGAYDSRNAT